MAYGLGDEVYEWRFEVLMFRLQADYQRRRRPCKVSAVARDKIRRHKGLARRLNASRLQASIFLERQKLLKRGYKV